MSHKSCRERTFPMRLIFDFEYHYTHSLRWLRHFLERLGRDYTLAVWQNALRDYDPEFLEEILDAEWEETLDRYAEEVEERLTECAARLYPVPVAGVSKGEAREIVEHMPPFKQIREHFATLDVKREITAYEALHLFRDGLALIAEEMLERYGKAGELMVYDALLEEWSARQREDMEVEAYMRRRAARFSNEREETDIFSAGLEVELISGTDSEVVTRVTECEWARYYQERHPRVGYLLACSVDNAAYRSFNERIRLQRTTTLMEGGEACDFRVYGLEEIFAGGNQAA